jgi:hypothetical protein
MHPYEIQWISRQIIQDAWLEDAFNLVEKKRQANKYAGLSVRDRGTQGVTESSREGEIGEKKVIEDEILKLTFGTWANIHLRVMEISTYLEWVWGPTGAVREEAIAVGNQISVGLLYRLCYRVGILSWEQRGPIGRYI